MEYKTFKDLNGRKLMIKSRKNTIIFIRDGIGCKRVNYQFDSDTFKELFEYIKGIANSSWKNIELKDVTSFGNDYSEYYDKEFDNNGYLDISLNQLELAGPVSYSPKLFQFNKKKIETFLYDFQKLIETANE